MKRILGFAALIILGLVGSACRDDVKLDIPEALTGDYKGKIIYESGTLVDSQYITWRFTSSTYRMRFDSTTSANKGLSRRFCDCDGDYFLTEAVELAQKRGNSTAAVCDDERNPTGRFVIVSRNETEVLLRQIISGISKDIILEVAN